MSVKGQPTFVSMKISAGRNGAELPEKLVSALARFIKRSPEDIRVRLETGSLRLSKVQVTGDLDTLVSALERNGLEVETLPHDRDASGRVRKTVGSPAILPSARAQDASDWKVGDIIEGLYEVVGSAAGGMAKVHFVFHRIWKMMLAIKTPHADAVKSEIRILRYLREAELWVDLGVHPNIATCFYARVIDGLPRLFIEYVDGGTLDQWKRGERLKDLRLVADLMLQFCHGMMYAEEMGMIHRDVKPANCLITSDRILKITDFGLVKRVDETTSEPRGDKWMSESGRHTDTNLSLFEGGVMGSPRYMAPERFTDKGREDIRSDIYSVGVMLYEVVLDQLPFKFPGEFSLPLLVKSHLRAKPEDPLSIRPDLPKSLAEIMLTCLEKKPENRYQSFGDLAQAMSGLCAELRPGREPRSRPNVLALKADSLNNQAVSLLDLGRLDEASALLDDAHSANTDHLEAVYNLHMLRWKEAEISDNEVIRRLESLKIEVRETPEYQHLIGLVSLQRGDASAGVRQLRRACKAAVHLRERWTDYGGDPANFVRALGFGPIGEHGSLGGHVKSVRAVAFKPEMHRAFSVGEDRSIRVWDTESGRCLKNIRTFTFAPVAGALSPDGARAITCYGEAFKTLDLWDLHQGRLLKRRQGMAVVGVNFSPDSRYVVVRESNGRVLVLDASLEETVCEIPPSEYKASTVVFFGSSEVLAIGDEAGGITIRRLTDSEPLYRAPVHQGPVYSIEGTADGGLILTGGADETARLVNATSGKEIRRFAGHRFAVVKALLISGEKFALTVASDGVMKIWDVESGRCYRTIAVPGEELTSAAVAPDGRWLLSAGARGSLRLWALDTRWFSYDFLEPALCRPKTFSELSSMHDAFRSAVDEFKSAWRRGESADALKVFERVRSLPGFCWSREAIFIRNALNSVCRRGSLKSSCFIRSFSGHREEVTSLAAAPDSLNVLSGSMDGTALLWDVVTGRCTARFAAGSPVKRVLFVPKLQGLLTWSQDGVLRSWDMKGNLVMELPDLAWPMALDPSGLKVRAMSPERRPIAVDLQSGARYFTGGVIQESHFLCFSDDLSTIYGLRDGKRVQHWSISTGRNEGLSQDLGLGLKVAAVCPASTDDRLVTGMESGEVVVFLAGSGYHMTTLREHRDAVRVVVPGPDPVTWITGSDDGTLKLWDIQAEGSITTLEGHASPVRAAALFPNHSLVASGGSDGSVRLWGLEWDLSIA